MDTTSRLKPSLDDLISSLNQIDALISFAMNASPTEFDPGIVFNYLWVISNVIGYAKMRCVELEKLIINYNTYS
ncbi:MAG: hypothetical protein EPO11_06670 [Gammaproteobacteria bacterium]|nr:MAG: hypothetical protein EPO11_06670 [Gammaproteobacteria bacterium]